MRLATAGVRPALHSRIDQAVRVIASSGLDGGRTEAFSFRPGDAGEWNALLNRIRFERVSFNYTGSDHAVLDGIDRTGRVAMTEPAASALTAFRQFNFERIYLRPASVRQAERVIGLLRGLVDSYVDVPARLPPGATGAHADLEPGSPEAAAVAVRYVSGMTDRFALAQGVELLGLRLEALPRGV